MSTVSGAPVTLAELRRVDLFDGIDDAQLAEWLAVAQLQEVAAGRARSSRSRTTCRGSSSCSRARR